MCNRRWKYGIEVQLYNGRWQLGTVWACYPNQFRALLKFVNGESDSSTRTFGPPTRIRRMLDSEEAEFTWPLE